MKKLLLVAAAAASFAAVAQAPLGTVTSVQGVVTASQGAAGTTVAPGAAIQNGMRFVTTSNGTVTLSLNSGCSVTVPAGHGVTVLQSMTCQQLQAAVQPVVPVASTAPASTSPGLVNGIVAAGGVFTVVQGVREVLNKDAPLSAR